MTRLNGYAVGMAMSGMLAAAVLAGEATTGASAGWNPAGGTAGANASWNGNGGQGIARTRTSTGDVNFARGLAVGMDADGMDLSFSHAIAGRVGPAYAGTFNLSIGRDGDVSGSYGGVVSQGGIARTAEAGGTTRSTPAGANATAYARGTADPNGRVQAYTRSYNQPRHPRVISATRYVPRYSRR